MQAVEGTEELAKARKEVRQAIVQNAEIVTCTLSSAGGDLMTLSKGATGFQALIVDEVSIRSCDQIPSVRTNCLRQQT